MPDARDLLFKDLEHFGESLWRNEETGEKRFNFFLTLVTAVAGGLVTLATSEHGGRLSRTGLIPAAIMALLAFGLLTYARILKRNCVTDQYLATLRYIRTTLKLNDADLSEYEVPLLVDEPWMHVFGGGFAQTVAAMNGAFLAVLLVSLEVSMSGSVLAGLLLGAALWFLAVRCRSKWKALLAAESEKREPAAAAV